MKVAKFFSLMAIVLLIGAVFVPQAHATPNSVTVTVHGTNTPSLTAQLTVTVVGNQVTFTILNTSSSPTGTITSFGIGPGSFGTLSQVSTTDTNFTFATTSCPTNTNCVNQYNGVVLAFSELTGTNFNGGHPPTGLTLGQSATFVINSTNGFNSLTALQIAQLVYVRFQAINCTGVTGPCSGSDVAHTITQPTPEPGSMALLGSGLLGLGTLVRRRKQKILNRA